tara:strand:- start:110 stop:313 length:204 start_codon:yes stop_codon:yes gene_type:complete
VDNLVIECWAHAAEFSIERNYLGLVAAFLGRVKSLAGEGLASDLFLILLLKDVRLIALKYCCQDLSQ